MGTFNFAIKIGKGGGGQVAFSGIKALPNVGDAQNSS